jgi:protein gp37
MGETTGIAWCHHTFNAWWGCTKISPACTNCYAATFDSRLGGSNWGPKAERKFFGAKHWNEPVKWDRLAAKAGKRRRVFCSSMADVFEKHENPEIDAHMEAARDSLWDLVYRTPNLDWMILTKRPENAPRMIAWGEFGHFCDPPANVWIGATVENQQYADERIPHLLAVPAVVHFLSCEPLLGPIDLSWWVDRPGWIDLVIAGCESGTGSRDTQAKWYRDLRDQCARTDSAFFLKQAIGERAMGCSTQGIWEGPGSWIKKVAGRDIIEQPYLDGVQHIAMPGRP